MKKTYKSDFQITTYSFPRAHEMMHLQYML